MRTILLLVVLFTFLTSTSSHGQTKASDPEIASLVRELSWNSVGGECNGVWRIFPDGTAAKRLVEIGKAATPQLIQVLTDEERGVAAHLILTAIWDGENITVENSVEGDDLKVAYSIHVYNGLRWTEVINWKDRSVTHWVDPADLAINLQKWKRKLSGK